DYYCQSADDSYNYIF
nr:immunoglobulin light chain junction region [Macaca mulatta]MOV72512.1 immunoglobulin light chain junction region [Macaca mulatta]MOV72746.1 immunoglobulin light chain junction region [Macaca mulatta]MOV73347.1 immunoglobulin light chain junction region [Macaca mulatta]